MKRVKRRYLMIKKNGYTDDVYAMTSKYLNENGIVMVNYLKVMRNRDSTYLLMRVDLKYEKAIKNFLEESGYKVIKSFGTMKKWKEKYSKYQN
ncbi:MAG: hypothetical protein M1481_01095 [Candidatus Thermoplasmatota archaeon]|jgi:hypothetical protein|nr:hypothetical protein [Candidatus Thermoplasmatota archaeon]MCL5962978.1 hypothetical protein [Candidatus Thermoplasmatota archaeon]